MKVAPQSAFFQRLSAASVQFQSNFAAGLPIKPVPPDVAAVATLRRVHCRLLMSQLVGGGNTRLFVGRLFLTRAKPPDDLAAEPAAQMFECVLEVECDGSAIDAEAGGNLAVRQLLDMRGDEYRSTPLRQFSKCPFQLFELKTGFGNCGRVRAIIGNAGDRSDFGLAEQPTFAFTLVLGDINGGAKEVVRRTDEGDPVGNVLNSQKCLVQSFPRKV
jgi:hypothetical protein